MTDLPALTEIRPQQVVAVVFAVFLSATMAPAQDRGKAFGRVVTTIPIKRTVEYIVWSPDQERIAVVAGGSVLMCGVSTGSIQWDRPYIHLGDDRAIFLDHGRSLLVHYTAAQKTSDNSNWNSILTVLDVRNGRVVREISSGDDLGVRAKRAASFDLSSDGTSLVVVPGNSSTVLRYNLADWSVVSRLRVDFPGPLIAFDDRRDRIILGGQGTEGAIETWQLSTQRRIARFPVYKTGLRRMILDRVSGHIITGGDGVLVPFQPPIPGRPETFTGVEDDPTTLVRAWNPSTGELKQTFSGPGRKVNALSLSTNGTYLAAAKARDKDAPKDAYVVAWTVATGRMIATSSYGQGFPEALAFSPDGRRLAVYADGELQIIELAQVLFQ